MSAFDPLRTMGNGRRRFVASAKLTTLAASAVEHRSDHFSKRLLVCPIVAVVVGIDHPADFVDRSAVLVHAPRDLDCRYVDPMNLRRGIAAGGRDLEQVADVLPD